LGRGIPPLGIFWRERNTVGGYLAIDQKLFDIYGLNVELTRSAGTSIIRALDSSSFHLGLFFHIV
jgi:hypothetical protein